MTTLCEEHLETGIGSPGRSRQSTPLLYDKSRSISYGSNSSGDTVGRCRVRADPSPEETDSGEEQEQEERRLLVKSREDQRQAVAEPKSWLETFIVLPLHRLCSILTGGNPDEVSLRLQNTGSVARDHLALERTFLSYTRTSLAIASGGVALIQLFNTTNEANTDRIEKYARPLGAGLVIMGLVVLGTGLSRFFVVQASLVQGMYPVTRLMPIFIAITLALLVTAVFWLLLTGRLEFD
ncbi:hypothetical protein NP233_g5756 [Leucocoprinus birnbaumii]|uniref:DUF202 domain-containing protein n=1 Tax=Leucocoprinus birnbaumii TaxID=56174 RepID=A0AAD5VTI4_9AGAR|nr:hypothetical protein NP233_g5756 [Leucocoprinus birnbaumii]